MRPNWKQLVMLGVTLLLCAWCLRIFFRDELPVQSSWGPVPMQEQLPHYVRACRAAAIGLGIGLVGAYALRTRKSTEKRWLTRRRAVAMAALVVVVGALAGLRFYSPVCNHVAVDWYGLLPEHRCPYMAPMKLMWRMVHAQEEFKYLHRPKIDQLWRLYDARKLTLDELDQAQREHQYASSVEQLLDEGLLPKDLVAAVAREGFVTKIVLYDVVPPLVSWTACCSSARYPQVVGGTRRWHPWRVEKTEVSRELLHP